MAVVLSASGTILVAIAAVLLYFFKDPTFGSALMVSSFNPKRQKIGARTGLGLMVCGAALQLAAILVAMD